MKDESANSATPETAGGQPASACYPAECTEDMLAAAVRQAVANHMFPVSDQIDKVGERWAQMRECIDAALNAAG